MERVSVITVFNDFRNFKELMLYNFNNINYPKELLEWIIVDDSKEYNGHLFPMDENIIYIHFKPEEIKKYLEDCYKKFDVSKNEKEKIKDWTRIEVIKDYKFYILSLNMLAGPWIFTGIFIYHNL